MLKKIMILLVTVFLMASCGDDTPLDVTPGDFGGSKDPSVINETAPITTEWVETVLSAVSPFETGYESDVFNTYSVGAHLNCYQVTKRADVLMLQISNKLSSGACPQSLMPQENVIAEFLFADGRISSTHELKTSWGIGVGMVYDRSEGKVMIDLCTGTYEDVCTLVPGDTGIYPPGTGAQEIISIEPKRQ